MARTRLPDLQAVGIAHGQRGKFAVLRIDFDQRDVIAFVRADKFRVIVRAVAERNGNRLRSLHHVKIGEDISARIDHEARAGALHRNRFHEHIVFQRARHDVGHGGCGLAVNLHVRSLPRPASSPGFGSGKDDGDGFDVSAAGVRPSGCPPNTLPAPAPGPKPANESRRPGCLFLYSCTMSPSRVKQCLGSTATPGCVVLYAATRRAVAFIHDYKIRTAKSRCATQTISRILRLRFLLALQTARSPGRACVPTFPNNR